MLAGIIGVRSFDLALFHPPSALSMPWNSSRSSCSRKLPHNKRLSGLWHQWIVSHWLFHRNWLTMKIYIKIKHLLHPTAIPPHEKQRSTVLGNKRAHQQLTWIPWNLGLFLFRTRQPLLTSFAVFHKEPNLLPKKNTSKTWPPTSLYF